MTMLHRNWTAALEKVKPYCFKVTTPTAAGSGFLITYRDNTEFCGVATAYHVVQHAQEWGEPVKLGHEGTRKIITLKESERVIIEKRNKDVAVILFSKGELDIPTNTLPLSAADKYFKPGLEIGWTGYPAVAPDRFSFFSGRISSFIEQDGAYLVDGVAINGVSGGPSFATFDNEGKVVLLGLVSAYIPNRALGESLPGVCFIVGIYPFYQIIQDLDSMEEAREKEPELSESE